jgi:hypothetical protein
MSHIVVIETQVRDPIALRAACRRLGLAEPLQQTVQLFASTATGLAVQLPGWRYPLVCDVATGRLQYDNFGGVWGDQQHLGRFLQAYAACKAQIEARRQGHSVTEQTLADGSIKLVIHVSGGAA